MIPTAVRFAAVSAKPVSSLATVSKVLINVASVGAIGGLLIGWPYFISTLEKKNRGNGNIPSHKEKVY